MSEIQVDTVAEKTSANGVTVDGLNIKDSKLVTANSVIGSNITADAVDATKIADNAISEEHLDVTSITGHSALTSVADGDHVLISDTSASAALKKITVANLVAGAGGGKIGQVIYGSTTTAFNTSSTSYVDTGLTATITPTSSSNKILVTVMQNGVYKDGSAEAGCQIQLLRGSTVISQLAKRAGGDNGTGTAATMSIGTVGASILDNSNTTSATTYKTQFKSASNASTVYVQIYTCDSTIILQEIVIW